MYMYNKEYNFLIRTNSIYSKNNGKDHKSNKTIRFN